MNNSEHIVELLEEIASTANFMRGMTLDPAIPEHVKEALVYRVDHLDHIGRLYEGCWE